MVAVVEVAVVEVAWVGGDDVVDVDVVVGPPNADPAGAPMAGAGPVAGAGARVVVGAPLAPDDTREGVVEPVGVTLALPEPAAAVTGFGPEASDDVVAGVVEVGREVRTGVLPPEDATSPTTTPTPASAASAIVSAVRPRTADHSPRGRIMASSVGPAPTRAPAFDRRHLVWARRMLT
ncbi:MAG TPA: hypothetical protein VKU86_09830, partial [Acidimicrobiales bacterium]|nr:hypothetical protein [Acidimicrobiales bacterium]